ncbi:MAG TPA: hypothetical protein VJB62_03795 [Patescibacteria group bacterium]|nr:hypothetical protein [Patescibacteria group bacterium]
MTRQEIEYLAMLKKTLTPLYTPPAIAGGHDLTHVLRMECLFYRLAGFIYDQLSGIIQQAEYITAVWLHNIDRSKLVKKPSPQETKIACDDLLRASPFSADSKDRIIDAVLQHAKWDDDPDDSFLLQALRLADKTDRIGVVGVICGAAFRGSIMLPYDPANPFKYQRLTEDDMRTLFQDYWRILEWWPKYPILRAFVGSQPLKEFLTFVRMYAAHIARMHEIPNTVEKNISQALGDCYEQFSLE